MSSLRLPLHNLLSLCAVKHQDQLILHPEVLHIRDPQETRALLMLLSVQESHAVTRQTERSLLYLRRGLPARVSQK